MKSLITLVCISAVLNQPVETEPRKRFFIPHSHLDLGWLETIASYYTKKVKPIIENVIQELETNPVKEGPLRKKFVFSEIGYIKEFLREDPARQLDKTSRIKKLQSEGQWEWVNGGMSQADSASAHYEDISDNFFYGLRFLLLHFNATSRSGWQLDPFGHSLSLAYISRLFGMDNLVITRIDAADRERRRKEGRLQFEWKFPDGKSTRTHIIDNYAPFKTVNCEDFCQFN